MGNQVQIIDEITGRVSFSENSDEIPASAIGKEMKFSWVALNSSQTAGYEVLNRFGFDGIDNVGTPTAIKLIAYIRATDGRVRIYDLTNAQVICETALITNIEPEILDCGVLSNISNTPAVWEVQAKRTGAGGSRCFVGALSVKF